jgi:Concanavalin A-like lectin/glucanases superfamily
VSATSAPLPARSPTTSDFSIEFWFNSTQGTGTGAAWSQGAGLVDAYISGTSNDFGVSLRQDGKVVAGVATTPDVSIVSSSGGYNNGNWHHVVFTRTKTTGALQLYVDGALTGSATGNTASLTSPTNINFGRIQTGNNYFSGTLDEIAVYTTALSGTTVTSHYNAGQ